MARWDRLEKTPNRWSDPEFEHQMALGIQLYEQGRYDEAEAAFQAADGLGMDSARPRLYLARIRQEGGDAQGAANDLRVLAGEYPQESEVWFVLGVALSELDDFDNAAQAFRRALDEEPDAPDALYHLALAQMGQEDWEGAQITLASLLQRNTRHGQAWLLMGTVETRLERWREALRAYEQALQLDPESERARAGIRLAQSKLVSR
jgi:cytochrome c-type biogenesis protein CcmH/NrfG